MHWVDTEKSFFLLSFAYYIMPVSAFTTLFVNAFFIANQILIDSPEGISDNLTWNEGSGFPPIESCGRTPTPFSDLTLRLHGFLMGLFLTALGLMMIFEGIPYFCFPDRFKDLALKISTVESRTLRIIGIAIIILGLMVVQFGRSLMHHD